MPQLHTPVEYFIGLARRHRQAGRFILHLNKDRGLGLFRHK